MSTRRTANNIGRREHPNAPLQVMPRRLVGHAFGCSQLPSLLFCELASPYYWHAKK
jgi:hypothetical protein